MFNRIAIMQPTYLPWLGYFAMIEKVDTFVFLDNVQFDSRSWQQRNKIKAELKHLWLTISVNKKGLSDQKINAVSCLNLEKDLEKHLASIRHCYRKSVHYDDFYDVFCDFVWSAAKQSKGYLARFNMVLTQKLCSFVGIEKPFILSSELNVAGKKETLLANICEHLGANSYLSPVGSKVYLEESDVFSSKGIEVCYHNYTPPHHPQLFDDFVENMACVDAFFNVQRDSLKELILSGCR